MKLCILLMMLSISTVYAEEWPEMDVTVSVKRGLVLFNGEAVGGGDAILKSLNKINAQNVWLCADIDPHTKMILLALKSIKSYEKAKIYMSTNENCK